MAHMTGNGDIYGGDGQGDFGCGAEAAVVGDGQRDAPVPRLGKDAVELGSRAHRLRSRRRARSARRSRLSPTRRNWPTHRGGWWSTLRRLSSSGVRTIKGWGAVSSGMAKGPPSTPMSLRVPPGLLCAASGSPAWRAGDAARRCRLPGCRGDVERVLEHAAFAGRAAADGGFVIVRRRRIRRRKRPRRESRRRYRCRQKCSCVNRRP